MRLFVYNARSVGDGRPVTGSKKKFAIDVIDRQPYLCMMCPRRFATAGYLKAHIRRHVGADRTTEDAHKLHR